MNVRVGLLLVVLSVLYPVVVWALMLDWDRNAEPDMKEYRIKGCDTGVNCTIDPSIDLAVVPQVPVGVRPSFAVTGPKEGRRAVTAVDTSGNESPMSVSLPFDAIAPAAPVGLRTR